MDYVTLIVLLWGRLFVGPVPPVRASRARSASEPALSASDLFSSLRAIAWVPVVQERPEHWALLPWPAAPWPALMPPVDTHLEDSVRLAVAYTHTPTTTTSPWTPTWRIR